MPEIGASWMTIAPSAKGFGKTLNKQVGGEVSASGKRIGRSFGKALTIGATGAAAGAAVGAVFLKGAISEAGNLEQSIGAINVIFGRSSKQMNRWSKGAAQAVGLSRNEFNELGTLIGSQLKNGGTAMDQLAPKTNKLIKLGADLSSMFGGTSREAVEALSSALKGERDPIEKYGVSLNQAKIDAKAAELGFKKVGSSLSAEANQAATLALIMDQTADAHGNFAKESGTLQGQQQRLSAQWDNMKATLGTALLPVATRFVTFLNQSVLPAFNRLRPTLVQVGTYIKTNIVPAVQSFGATLAPLVTKVVGFFSSMRSGTGELGQVQSTFTSVFASVQSTVQSVVTIVTRLWSMFGATLTRTARSSFGNVLRVVKGIFNVIAGVFKVFASVLKGDWSGAWKGIQQVARGAGQVLGGIVRQIGAMMRNVFEIVATTVKATFKGMWNAVKQAGSNVLGWFKGLPGKIAGYVAGFGTLLYNAGRELIGGLIRGIEEKAKDLAAPMKGLANKVKGYLPGSPVKEGPLRSWNNGKAGKRLMQLLIDGINASTGKVGQSVERVMDRIDKALKKKSITKRVAKDMREMVAVATKQAGKLATLISARANLAAEVAGNLRSEWDLSALTAPNEFGFSPSAGGAVRAVQAIVARMRAFASKLAGLVKQGMPNALVSEIAGMGSAEGSRVADIFLKATSSERRSLSTAYSDFNRYAAVAGNVVAGQRYNGAIADQRQLVAGMERAIERGLRNSKIEVTVGIDKRTSAKVYVIGKKEAAKRQ